MKIATRNLLADLLLAAFEDRIAATALHCLAAGAHADKQTPPTGTVEQLLRPVQSSDRETVLTALQKHPLLTWSGHGQSAQWSLAPAFLDEGQAIADKLTRFSAALQEWSPNDNDTPRQQALRKGALLFNHQLFFEVHEVLEKQWVQESGDEKLFLQGLIQIAVALYHRERGNLRGALSLLPDGVEKIAPQQPAFLGIELQEFLQNIEACRAELLRLGERGQAQFRSEMIPRLRFIAA